MTSQTMTSRSRSMDRSSKKRSTSRRRLGVDEIVRRAGIRRLGNKRYKTGMKRHSTLYHPRDGHVVGFNFGTSVRPEVLPITITSTGDETIASFFARGGVIKTGRSKLAKGANVLMMRSNPTRVVVSRG